MKLCNSKLKQIMQDVKGNNIFPFHLITKFLDVILIKVS